MARFDSNSFFESLGYSSDPYVIKYLGLFREIFLFYHENMCVYSLESPHRGDSNEHTQHKKVFIEDRKDIPKLFPFASWPDAMINPQWLELPIYRTNYHSPKMFEQLEFDWSIEDDHEEPQSQNIIKT